MRAKAKQFVWMITAATLQLADNKAMARPACQLLKTAADYIAKRFPHSDSTGLKPVITERGNLWELTYELPKDTLGGVPIITIDKRDCKVVRAIHTQ